MFNSFSLKILAAGIALAAVTPDFAHAKPVAAPQFEYVFQTDNHIACGIPKEADTPQCYWRGAWRPARIVERIAIEIPQPAHRPFIRLIPKPAAAARPVAVVRPVPTPEPNLDDAMATALVALRVANDARRAMRDARPTVAEAFRHLAMN